MGFCSTHTHFEFLDTANALPNPNHKFKPDLYRALKAYADAGYSAIAVTEHGSVTSYEDLRALVKNKDYGKLPLKVLFGIEAYIRDDNKVDDNVSADTNTDEDTETEETVSNDTLYNGSHCILIAKNLQGYHELIGAINSSVYNKTKNRMEMPIEAVKTLNNGNVMCCSACIGGIFGNILLKESNEKRAYERARVRLERYNYIDLSNRQAEFDLLQQKAKQTWKTKLNNAKRVYKKAEVLGDTAEMEQAQRDIDIYERIKTEAEEATLILTERAAEKTAIEKQMKEANKHRLKKDLDIYNSYRPVSQEDRAVFKQKMDKVYDTFSTTFGDDFYIEVQNHDDPKEMEVYNTLVAYCKDTGKNVKFMASNDTHIACKKDDVNATNMNYARDIMKMVRMKIYDSYNEQEKEFCIKTDDEIAEMLTHLQGNYFDILSGTERESQLTRSDIDMAISNTHILDTFDYSPLKEDHYPAVPNATEKFEASIAEGIKRIFGCTEAELPEEYRERLAKEREIMTKMNVIAYHVIVEEFLRFARAYGRIPKERRHEVEPFLEDTARIERFVEENNFPKATATGVGRGSAGGSLICYCMGITGIDPIKNKLSMERYLNLERQSMPKQYWVSIVNPITQGCA